MIKNKKTDGINERFIILIYIIHCQKRGENKQRFRPSAKSSAMKKLPRQISVQREQQENADEREEKSTKRWTIDEDLCRVPNEDKKNPEQKHLRPSTDSESAFELSLSLIP